MKLFLLLPTLTLATIDIQFSGTIDFQRGKLSGIFDATKYTNIDGRSLTDIDVKEIRDLNTEELKDATERYNGKRPDEVLLSCPRDQIRLCKRDRWNKLKKRIVPTKVNAMKPKSKTVLVTKKPFYNYEDSPKNTVIDVSHMVQNNLTSQWNGDKTASDKVYLDMDFRINCDKTYINKTVDWGKTKIAHKTEVLREKKVVIIPPSKEVLAEMSAKKGLIQLAVYYNVTLTGDVIAVYDDMYKGKRHHNLDIGALLATKGVSSSKIVTQIVTYKFYYGSSLKIVKGVKRLSDKPMMTASNKKHAHKAIQLNGNKHEAKHEKARPKVEGMGNIKMAARDELKKYILKDIEDDMYVGLTENETREDKSDSSEESEEN